MRITAAFQRICLLWLFYCQAGMVIWLWEVQATDTPELFGSPVLLEVFGWLGGLAWIGMALLFLVGISLALIYALKERRLGLNTFNALAGLMSMILVVISFFVIVSSMPEMYGPPPGLAQYVSIGIVVLLDIVFVVAIRRLIGRQAEGYGDIKQQL